MKIYKLSNCLGKKDLVFDTSNVMSSKETILSILKDFIENKDNCMIDWEYPND